MPSSTSSSPIVCWFERVGDEEQALLEAERPGVGDALDEEVSGILDRRQLAGVRARRGPVERARRPAAQKLVRAARRCTTAGSD